MDPIEHQLREALQRQQPSPGFDARVSAAARKRVRWTLPRWIPAAAAVLVIAAGGVGYRWHQGVTARREVMLAMRITGEKLHYVQTHIKETAR